MNQRVLKVIGKEVEEGWSKVREFVLFGEGVHRYSGDVWSSVEVECGPQG
jgi:hypothetical protein